MTKAERAALIARARQLDSKRTPGAWAWDDRDELIGRCLIATERADDYVAAALMTGYESVTVDVSPADAAFIVAASELIPALVNELERIGAERNRLRTAVELAIQRNEQNMNGVAYNYADFEDALRAALDLTREDDRDDEREADGE